MNVAYYKAYSRNIRDSVYLEKEKRRRYTVNWDYVYEIRDFYLKKGFMGISGAGIALNVFYKKNCFDAKKENVSEKTEENLEKLLRSFSSLRKFFTHVLKVISRPELLCIAYRRLKGYSVILTPGAAVSKEQFNNYSESPKEIFFRKKVTPDGFSMLDVYIVSRLIVFPWGSCKRIWLDKPGFNKKRPELRVFL